MKKDNVFEFVCRSGAINTFVTGFNLIGYYLRSDIKHLQNDMVSFFMHKDEEDTPEEAEKLKELKGFNRKYKQIK